MLSSNQCSNLYLLSYPQVYIGPYQSRQVVVKTMRNLDSLKEGYLVAVHCEDATTEPSIGEVKSLTEDKVEIVWLKGGYTTAWTTWVLNEGRKKVEWRDSIPKTSVLLYDFELTKTKHLRKATVTHLRKAYEQLRTQSP